MGTSRLPLDPNRIFDRVGAVAADAASVAVGLGILGVNRLQALRRDAAARLADLAEPGSHDPDNPASDNPGPTARRPE